MRVHPARSADLEILLLRVAAIDAEPRRAGRQRTYEAASVSWPGGAGRPPQIRTSRRTVRFTQL
jgi:hypothetical protein